MFTPWASYNFIPRDADIPLGEVEQDILSVELGFPPLDTNITGYVVFGKVEVVNHDGDPQNCEIRLTSNDMRFQLDRTDVRVQGKNDPSGTSASVSVMARVRDKDLQQADGTTVQTLKMRGTMFNGSARNASLIAITVQAFLQDW